MPAGAKLRVAGYVRWDHCRNGLSLQHGEGSNLITTCGLAWLAAALAGAPGTADPMQYIKAGDSTTSPSMSDDEILGDLFKGMLCDDGGDNAGDQGGTGLNDGELNTILWRARFVYDDSADPNDFIINEMVLATHITKGDGTILARFLTGPQGIRGYVNADEIVVAWALTIGG